MHLGVDMDFAARWAVANVFSQVGNLACGSCEYARTTASCDNTGYAGALPLQWSVSQCPPSECISSRPFCSSSRGCCCCCGLRADTRRPPRQPTSRWLCTWLQRCWSTSACAASQALSFVGSSSPLGRCPCSRWEGCSPSAICSFGMVAHNCLSRNPSSTVMMSVRSKASQGARAPASPVLLVDDLPLSQRQ